MVRERLSFPGFPQYEMQVSNGSAANEREWREWGGWPLLYRATTSAQQATTTLAASKLQPSNSPRRSQLKHISPDLPRSPQISPQVPLLLKQLVLIRDGATPDPWGHLS